MSCIFPNASSFVERTFCLRHWLMAVLRMGSKEIGPFGAADGNSLPLFPYLGKYKLHDLFCLIWIAGVVDSEGQAVGVMLFK